MSRARRLLVILGVAACVGAALAFVDRARREPAKPNADGDPSGEAARVALGKPTSDPPAEDPKPVAPFVEAPKRVDPVTPRVEPKADPVPEEDPMPARKAAYAKIIAALQGVEAAAIRKYGRKPVPDDKAEFVIPYKAFVNSQTQLTRKKLANDLGLPEVAIDEIRKEGDRAGWPRR